MELPIDARLAPFRDKYIDEETPLLANWFIFGYDSKDLTLHVSSAGGGCDDVIIGLTAAQAARVIIARDQFVRAMLSILNEGHK